MGPTGRIIIQGPSDLLGDPVGREEQSLVEVDIALGDAPPGVSQQARDGQFGKPEVSGHAGEGMPKNVGCYVLELGRQAESLEHPDDADEVAVADLARENIGVLFSARGLGQKQLKGRLADRAKLGAALCRGKAHARGLGIDPGPLKRQHLHPTEASQEHEADRRQRDRAFLVRLADRFAEGVDLPQRQASLDLVVRADLPDALRGVMADEMQPGGLFEDRVQHPNRSARHAGTTGSHAAATFPGFGCLSSDDVGLKAFDVGECKALDLPIPEKWADVSFDPTTVEGQGLLGDRPATAAEQFAALRLFEIPVADLCHRGGRACGPLLRNGVASLRDTAELVADTPAGRSGAMPSAALPRNGRATLAACSASWIRRVVLFKDESSTSRCINR